jgi:hypothetical protein
MDFLKGALARARLPPLEQKVHDATDSAPWGPHGAVLAEIARCTTTADERAQVMAVLWRRVAEEKPEQWRVVYKALSVFEYLVANGSLAAVDELRGSASRLSSLSSFQYKDPEGKDQARLAAARRQRTQASWTRHATRRSHRASPVHGFTHALTPPAGGAAWLCAGHQRTRQERNAGSGTTPALPARARRCKKTTGLSLEVRPRALRSRSC